MRIYPDLTTPRLRAMFADALLLSALLLCLAAGRAVHEAVLELDVLGRGVERAGTQVQESFDAVGEVLDGTPGIGDRLDRALSRAGERTGEPVVAAGARGRVAVADLALLLGWLVGGLPALVLALTLLPRRVTNIRSLLAARRVFGASERDPEELRLLAMRAAFSLPYGDLLRHTRDPMADLAAGNLAPLLAALGDQHGLRLRPVAS